MKNAESILKILEDYKAILEANNNQSRNNMIEAILQSKFRVSPRYMTDTSLDLDEIFVFGSNTKGSHGGRASKYAVEHFGAEKGVLGLCGRSYALVSTLPDTQKLEPYIQEFIKCAAENPEKKFMVTRIGCGSGRHTDEEIAPLFRNALVYKNIYLPQSFLDVLLMTKYEERVETLVPFTYKTINSFTEELERQLSTYYNWLKDALANKYYEVFRDGFKYRERTHILDNVEIISTKITNSVKLYLRGLPAAAYKELKDGIDKIHSFTSKNSANLFDEISVNSEKRYFRMCVEPNSWKRREVDCYRMFHMPFSLREALSTQRYSIAGFPSLYLSESVFGCWEELGRPNLNECMVSALKNEQTFRVMDLTIPNFKEWEIDEITSKKKRFLLTQFCRFPLIIACTFWNNNCSSRTFKPEYIIPQLMLQIVKDLAYESNRKISDKDKREIFGIKYTSVNLNRDQGDTRFDFKKEKYDNYVIPVQDINHEYCSRLCNTFHITNPICEEIERSKDPNARADAPKCSTHVAIFS